MFQPVSRPDQSVNSAPPADQQLSQGTTLLPFHPSIFFPNKDNEIFDIKNELVWDFRKRYALVFSDPNNIAKKDKIVKWPYNSPIEILPLELRRPRNKKENLPVNKRKVPKVENDVIEQNLETNFPEEILPQLSSLQMTDKDDNEMDEGNEEEEEMDVEEDVISEEEDENDYVENYSEIDDDADDSIVEDDIVIDDDDDFLNSSRSGYYSPINQASLVRSHSVD